MDDTAPRRLSRRKLLVGGGLAAAGTVMLRPADRSGPRADYFLRLQGALKAAGLAQPCLVIDRQRLDANAALLARSLPGGMGYRIVVKSLPSARLIERVRAATGTDRLMTFNLPMLRHFAAAMPDARQFLGKPLPAAAVQTLLARPGGLAADALDRITFLLDTPERLSQYAALARSAGRGIACAIEIDVGLHRGGQEPGAGLDAMLHAFKAAPELRFAGMMGYEPHVPKVPEFLGMRARSLAHAWDSYRAAQDQTRAVLGAEALAGAVLNAAGSPTFRLYKDTSVANEVSVGSALVKPTDFDTPLLEPFQPASFIAAPVLKRTATRLPHGFDAVTAIQRAWDPNTRETLFIYGGHWLARPVDPPGLQYNDLFGRSSNQEMLNAGAGLSAGVDDFVFLRPHQSEAVFLQFGDIAIYDGENIAEFWPVLPASA